MRLSNVTIGRKLGLLVGSNLVLLACFAGMNLWSNHQIDSSMDKMMVEEQKGSKTTLIAANTSGIAVLVSNMVVNRNADEAAQSRIVELRKEYMDALEELKTKARTEEGRRLLGSIEQTAAVWRGENLKLIEFTKAEKHTEAARVYREQVVPRLQEMGAAIAAFQKFREGRMRQMREADEVLDSRIDLTMIALSLIALVFGVTTGILITRSITKPLGATVAHLDVVAAGDVSRDVPAEQLERGDEIGRVSKAVQAMTLSLREVLKSITAEIQVLSSSSAELSSNSGQMAEGSRQASEKAHSVAAAAEEVSANVTTVAAGVEQAATNLTSVSSHTEQMTATIGEIAGNSEKARHITEEATRQAARITEQMNQLGTAAREIGKVTETITEISSQTNLLALNATIEAARAGAAGKGFAVVANEIKELAQQTATATEDIKTRIQGVQTSATSGISEIGKVSQVIHEVSGIVSSIAAAIEEQATVTKDISQNIAEASTGVKDVNQRVAETSQATREIAKEIAVVDRAAIEMAEGTGQVQISATELSKSAEHLQGLVSRFRV